MRLTTLMSWIAGGICLYLLICTFWYFPYGNPKEAARKTACLSNVKQQAIAFLIYAEDGDGRFPARDLWMDKIEPIVRSKYAFHVPQRHDENEPWPYGYAFNAALSQAKAPPHPETTVLTYDSVNLGRNASDLVTSLPTPGRHDGKNHLSYADGHARAITMEKVNP